MWCNYKQAHNGWKLWSKKYIFAHIWSFCDQNTCWMNQKFYPAYHYYSHIKLPQCGLNLTAEMHMQAHNETCYCVWPTSGWRHKKDTPSATISFLIVLLFPYDVSGIITQLLHPNDKFETLWMAVAISLNPYFFFVSEHQVHGVHCVWYIYMSMGAFHTT